MTQFDKLADKLKEKPKNFTWDEAVRLLGKCGFDEIKRKPGGRKGGGSHRSFFNQNLNQVFKMSQPHPGNELKQYQVKELLELLQKTGCIE